MKKAPIFHDYRCNTRWCRSPCCMGKVIHNGQRLHAFGTLLDNSVPRTFTITILGDSVSRFNGFATSNTFIDMLRRTYPKHQFNVVQKVKGGRSPEEIYHKGPSLVPENSDVVVLHYLRSGGSMAHMEDFIRMLLEKPEQPLILLILHCPLAFWQENVVAYHFDHKFWIKEYHSSLMLLQHYRIPFVSACDALDILLKKTCQDEWGFSSIVDLEHSIFPNGDPTHYNRQGSILEGCLLSNLVLNGKDVEPIDDYLPTPIHLLHPTQTNYYLSTSDENLFPDVNKGWEIKRGGKGGDKVWWESSTPGDSFEIQVNSSVSIALEVYTHHSLPMGQIDVFVDDTFVKRVDACCDEPCVGTPGRGIYQRFVVYENKIQTPHYIRIVNKAKSESKCSEVGNKFCLTAIMGECEGRWCAK